MVELLSCSVIKSNQLEKLLWSKMKTALMEGQIALVLGNHKGDTDRVATK